MDELPVVLLVSVLEFSTHEELHAVERTCRSLCNAVSSGGLWEERTLRRAAIADEDAPTTERGWKDVHCLVNRRVDRELRLLHDVIACSSVDRPVESPTNTLEPSRCWLEMRSSSDRSVLKGTRSDEDLVRLNIANVAQIQCGCETGEACYWSSSPSTDKNAKDFIDYVVFEKSVVSRVQIVPYRAFWHPDAPTYAPSAISVTFYHDQSMDASDSTSHKAILYQSPVYPVMNEMQLQEFRLPKRIWLPHGAIMRLNLLGRHQAETFDLPAFVPVEDHVPNYYSCLSYVNAMGVSVYPREELERQRGALC